MIFFATMFRRGGKLPSWSPKSLPNLKAWYTAAPLYCFQDAAATIPCTDGTAVYTWLDRSGLGFHQVQATSGSRPTMRFIGGSWLVRFDGISSFMQTTWTLNGTIGSYAVANMVAYTGSGPTIFDGKTQNQMRLYNNGSSQYGLYAGGGAGAVIAPSPILNTTYTFRAIFIAGAGNSQLSYNGGAVNTSGTLGGINTTGLSLGGQTGGSLGQVDYREHLVITSAPTTPNDNLTLQYLRRWGHY